MSRIIHFCLATLIGFSSYAQTWSPTLDLFFEKEAAKLNIPNLEVQVFTKDSILYQRSLGNSSPQSGYFVGSVSKSLTAFGILRLVDQGKLGLEHKLSELIPGLSFQVDQNKITIRHLLNHTSGIRKIDGFKRLPSLDQVNQNGHHIHNEPLEPLRHQYSNLNYALLGLVIEQVSGLSFGKYMEQEVFIPLGMTNSRIGTRDELSPYLISHYQYWGPFPVKSPQVDYASTHIPAGFISCSSEDLRQYLALQLGSGIFKQDTLLSSVLLKDMHRPWDGTEIGYAMGWKRGNFQGETIYQHLGSTANSYSGIFFFPEKGVGVVFLTNSNSLSFTENLMEGTLNIIMGAQGQAVSSSEWYLRVGILIGYAWVFISFIHGLTKLAKGNSSKKKRRAWMDIGIYLAIIAAIAVLFPILAQIPYIKFVQLQPDLGVLMAIGLIFPLLLSIIRAMRKHPNKH